MALFGATVSAYNQKPGAALTKFQNNFKVPTATPITAETSKPKEEAYKPSTADSNKAAVGGASTLNASASVNMIKSPVFQANDIAQIGRGNGSEYSRLNAIDARTQILDDQMADATASRTQGYSSGGDMFGGGEGSGLDNEQLNYARQIASIGKSRGMDDNAIQIALMTALAESGLRNVAHGDRDSVGLFQQRTSQGWGSTQQIMDPSYSANKFYDSLAKTQYASMSPWQAAQAVQRSAYADGSNYQKQYALAQKAFQSLTPQGGSTVGQTNSAAAFIQANNNKYIDMDGYYGAQCVDLYNKYTSQFVGGKNFPVGWAPEIFTKYDANAYTRLAGNQASGRMGDVVVFNRGGSTPLGHVGIVIADNGNGTLRMLSSNYGTGPSGSMNSTIHNISKASLMGYLRPKKLG